MKYAGAGTVNYQTIGACYITGIDNNNKEAIYSLDEKNNSMFTIYYDNGISDNYSCPNGRSTVINWHCNSTSNNKQVNMKSIQLETCEYQLDLYSNDACKTG